MDPNQIQQLTGSLQANTQNLMQTANFNQQMLNQMKLLQEQQSNQIKNQLAQQLGISNPITNQTGPVTRSRKYSQAPEKIATTTKHHAGIAIGLPDQAFPQDRSVIIEMKNGKRKRSYAHITDPAERRRVRNREVAKTSRDSKRHYVSELERKITDLKNENLNLETQNNTLRSKFNEIIKNANLSHDNLIEILGENYYEKMQKPQPNHSLDPTLAVPTTDVNNVPNKPLKMNPAGKRAREVSGQSNCSDRSDRSDSSHTNSSSSHNSTGNFHNGAAGIIKSNNNPNDTNFQDITLSNHQPQTKKMKQNITVCQDFNGFANKFTSSNGRDNAGSMTINRPAAMENANLMYGSTLPVRTLPLPSHTGFDQNNFMSNPYFSMKSEMVPPAVPIRDKVHSGSSGTGSTSDELFNPTTLANYYGTY